MANDNSDLLTRKEFNEYKVFMQEKVASLYRDIKDIEAYKNPLNHEGKFEVLFEVFQAMQTNIAQLKSQVASYATDGRFLELFKDLELQDLFAQSNLGLKDIADKFKVSMPQASQYAKGNIDNLTIRNQLGKWFRQMCLQNKDNIRKA